MCPMDAPILRWTVGLIVSLGVGWLFTGCFLKGLQNYIERRSLLQALQASIRARPKEEGEKVPPSLTGLIERLFFTMMVATDISGTAVAMITWIFAKMVTNWNRLGREVPVSRAFSALLAGLVSMLFALIGGMICRGTLWL